MNYDQLESWILNNQKLTRQQAINIWNGYCLKRILGKDKQDPSRQHIHETFDQRRDQQTIQQNTEKDYKKNSPITVHYSNKQFYGMMQLCTRTSNNSLT